MGILKRTTAYILALMLVISCVGCEKNVKKRVEKKPAEEPVFFDKDVYTEVVQDAVSRYGIIDEDAEGSYDMDAKPFTGVMSAKRIDLTGDGEDELFLMYFDDDIQMEVYEAVNGRAVKKWNGTGFWGGIFDVNIYETPEGVYWCWTASRHFPADMITYRDGEYISAADMGDFTEEELSRYRDGEYFTGGLMQEGQAYHNIFADRLGLDISNVEYGSDNHLFGYHADGILHSVDEQEFLTEWDVKIPKVRLSPLQALGGIKYYGDPGICNMTSEMASAYADAIESDKAFTDKEGYYNATLRAALVDVAGDGMPLLITATAESQIYDGWYFMEDIFVWTWDGESAQKYDFEADTITGTTFGHDFFPGDSNASIVVGDGVALDVGGYAGMIYYTVSNAQIKKVRHEMWYSAYTDYDDKTMARGGRLPFVDSAQQGEYGYIAPVDDLIASGWIGEGDEDDEFRSFSTYSVDGQQVSGRDSFWNEYSYTESLNKEKYEIYYASTGAYELSGETTLADDSIEALSAYADSVGRPYYPSYEDILYILSETQTEAISERVAEEFDGTVGEVYRLSEDLYYVTVYVDGEFQGGTVVKNIENGAEWTVVSSSSEIMTEEALAQSVTKDNAVSNIEISYEETENAQEYLDIVFRNIDGTVPNNAAKEELADYAQKYISDKGMCKVRAGKNRVTIDEDTIGKIHDSAMEAKSETDAVFEKYGVELNKKITVILRIVCKNMNGRNPMQVSFTDDCADAVGEADAVEIKLCEGCSIRVAKDNLLSLIDEYGSIDVTVAKAEDGSYDIRFTEDDGEVIHQLSSPMTFTLPAENELCTVYAEFKGGTDNWGGQFDEARGELSFETSYSGKYTVAEENADITDISGLSEEHRKAIKFMVSKGYFTLDDGRFNPDGTLTRYAFSEALVRMFFILDRSKTTTFSDVPEDSRYYSVVASGEDAEIIEGYDDNTFRGENDVLREEVLALCSRTLRERKGYTEPSDPSEYLHFTDNDKISDWAEKEIALTVRETLIDDGGMLYPDAAISRADGALLLYRLFMLLYEIEPVSMEVEEEYEPSLPVAGALAGGAAVVLAGGAVLFALIRRRRKIKF